MKVHANAVLGPAGRLGSRRGCGWGRSCNSRQGKVDREQAASAETRRLPGPPVIFAIRWRGPMTGRILAYGYTSLDYLLNIWVSIEIFLPFYFECVREFLRTSSYRGIPKLWGRRFMRNFRFTLALAGHHGPADSGLVGRLSKRILAGIVVAGMILLICRAESRWGIVLGEMHRRTVRNRARESPRMGRRTEDPFRTGNRQSFRIL
jgi:hypothetical protein